MCSRPRKTDSIIKAQVNRQTLAASGCNVANQPLQVTVKKQVYVSKE
jgi:hypothetical protein